MFPTNSTNDEVKTLNDYISLGSEIAGGVAGAAVGFITGGPIGAVAGAAAGPVITYTFDVIAQEFKQRLLGPREVVRIGATLAYAVAKIEANMGAGQQVRQDDFFQEQPDDRSTAKEIFEGVLLISQREYQEKKLKFYGNLLANIAFRTDIGRDLANALIKQLESMSYRQICLLSLSERKDEFSTFINRRPWLDDDNAAEVSLQADMIDLYQKHILSSGEGIFGDFRATVLGKLLFDLMELEDTDKVELEKIACLLL